MAKEVRLSDIAQECGVSVVTVAKVLNHSGGSTTRVSAKTAARVSEVAAKLNYRPNLSARNLRVGDSQLIGVLIDSESVGGLARLLAEIERCADLHGYRIMVAEEHDRVSKVIAGYQSFRQYGAAGVICVSHDYLENREELYRFFASEPKVVFIGRPRLQDAVYVDVACREKSRVALEYLWRSGRRKIAFLTHAAPYLALDERRDGFCEVLCSLGGTMGTHGDIWPVTVDELAPLKIKSAVHAALERQLPQFACDAIVAMTDEYAGYAMQYLHAHGFRVPEEIAVIGHGNDRFGEILTPELASVDDDLAGQGRLAVELLCRMFDEQAPTPFTRGGNNTIYPKLVWRPSAGKHPDEMN